MTGQIDGSAAGSYRNALERAASRFCVKYSEEAWHIAGVLVQTGLSIRATWEAQSIERVLPPVLDMEPCIMEVLEEFRSSSRGRRGML